MKLRAYKSSDASDICSFITSKDEFYRWSADRYNKYPIEPSDIDANYKPMIESGDFYAYVLVDDDESVVGHVTLRYPDKEDRTSMRLGFIIVDPSKRGQGIAKVMLSLAIAFAKEELGAKHIDIGVYEDNIPARRCYEALGFREYKREMNTLPIGELCCVYLRLC
ncbi:MAG TPA: GNAT family N-acetyltransferase [Eubacterium sp.]|nr:GNAT family N-acetyltransferase [Eubacterium sp.]